MMYKWDEDYVHNQKHNHLSYEKWLPVHVNQYIPTIMLANQLDNLNDCCKMYFLQI